MCRVPIEVMALIIGYLKRPLPSPGDKKVTWRHLHQGMLVKMMRVSRVSSRSLGLP